VDDCKERGGKGTCQESEGLTFCDFHEASTQCLLGELYFPVKFLPATTTKWFSSTDKLAGTDAAIGKAGDNTNEWSL
jgi:hypothetical protein